MLNSNMLKMLRDDEDGIFGEVFVVAVVFAVVWFGGRRLHLVSAERRAAEARAKRKLAETDVPRQGAEAWSPHDAKMLLLQCSEQGDVASAWRYWQLFEQEGIQLCPETYKVVLKMLVSNGDPRAHGVFDGLQRFGKSVDRSCLVALLQCCEETKFTVFADEVVSYASKTIGTCARLYHACMRVYAADGKFWKVCYLYDQMESEGVKVGVEGMHSFLLDSASRCSRSDISEVLTQEMEQSCARKVCLLQCLFASVFSAFCLCMLSALGLLSTQLMPSNAAPDRGQASLAVTIKDDLSFVLRMLFGPLVVTAVTYGRPGALDNVDSWQHALWRSALLI